MRAPFKAGFAAHHCLIKCLTELNITSYSCSFWGRITSNSIILLYCYFVSLWVIYFWVTLSWTLDIFFLIYSFTKVGIFLNSLKWLLKFLVKLDVYSNLYLLSCLNENLSTSSCKWWLWVRTEFIVSAKLWCVILQAIEIRNHNLF